MRALIAMALACCVGVCGAALEPPAPSASKASEPQKAHAQKPNGERSDKAKDADKSPLVVFKIDASPIAKTSSGDQTEQGYKESPWKGVWDALIALGTVALAIVTSILVYYTRGLLVEAKKQFPHFMKNVEAGAKSADAAKEGVELARDEFHAAHRPRLIVRRVRELIEDKDVVGVEYSIYNIGDAKGKLIAVSSRIWLIAEQDNLPPVPPYNPPEPLETIIEPGAHILIKARVPDSDQEALGMQYGFYGDTKGPGPLLLLGYIDYSDTRGAKRETAFLRQFDFATKRFSPVPHQEYEYQD